MSTLLIAAGASAQWAVVALFAAVSVVLALRARRAARLGNTATRQKFEAMRIELAAREANEALLATRIGELERQNVDLEQFAHIASHDLRAPLRAIANLALWIEEDSPSLSTDGREHLRVLRSRVGRLERLLSDLLSYARAGRGEAAIEPVDVSSLAEEIADENGAEKLALTISWGGLKNGAGPPILETAVAPLRQVLANLVANAVKHHDGDRAQVTLDIAAEGKWLLLTVTDDGPGIDPVLIPKALAMFQTLKPKGESESSGMGLALVKRLVASAGGELELSSPVRDNRGLAACVRWPLVWPVRVA